MGGSRLRRRLSRPGACRRSRRASRRACPPGREQFAQMRLPAPRRAARRRAGDDPRSKDRGRGFRLGGGRNRHGSRRRAACPARRLVRTAVENRHGRAVSERPRGAGRIDRGRQILETQCRADPESHRFRGQNRPDQVPSRARMMDSLTADAPIPIPAAAAPVAKLRVLVLANQKGGVGKTTTAINLGTALAAIGEEVLIVDLDPQGNASTGLGIDRKSRRVSTYHVLTGEADLKSAILATAVPRLSVAPSTLDLLGVELEIAHERNRAHRLRHAIETLGRAAPAGAAFTYVLIDCPPSLNLLTVNALTAADAVLVPLQCEFFALEGLSQLLKTVEQVRSTLNPRLSIHGIVLTMFDPRNNLSGQVVADVRQFMGEKVYETMIPRNVRVSEAPSHGKPVLLYDLKCAGSQAYLRLASEIIRRERALKAA